MTLPAEVTYGHVNWWALEAIADGADLDTLPDDVVPTGTVTFSPVVSLKVASTPPLTVLPRPITVELDDFGKLSVDLIATDSANINPLNWTYWVSFAVSGIKLPAFSMSLPGGTTVDLTSVIPVASSTGTPITRGAGIVSAGLDGDGNLMFGMSDGSTLSGPDLQTTLDGIYVSARDESGAVIPGKRASIQFTASGFPANIILEDA